MKKKRLVLGVTGGIATGKSTVMKMLAERGIPGISSDEIAHHAIRKGKPAYRNILRRFGRKVLRSYGQVCRTKLGRIVFQDPAERAWLEKRVHPVVVKELKRFIRRHKGVIAVDIPLLFETGLDKLVDKIIVMDAPERLQIQRLRKRNGLSSAEARQRIRSQMPLSRKRAKADWVIKNGGTLPQLRKQVERAIASKWKRP